MKCVVPSIDLQFWKSIFSIKSRHTSKWPTEFQRQCQLDFLKYYVAIFEDFENLIKLPLYFLKILIPLNLSLSMKSCISLMVSLKVNKLSLASKWEI